MKEKKYNPPSLILNEGHFIDLYYDGYEEMQSIADNHEHQCTYQLLPNALKGHHQILQLHSMQINYVERPGGMMNNSGTAKDSLTFAVLEECADKACFHRMKPQTGDIVFYDDRYAYNFMTNDSFKLCAVNIKIETLGALLPQLIQACNHIIKDTDGVMSKTLRSVLKQFTDQNGDKKDKKAIKDTEEKIKNVITKLLSEQTPILPKLTKGEQIVLDIRDQVYRHMDGKISVKSLSKQHQISEKTLQNSFKSLFGFTPVHFLRQLKLNLVFNELNKSDPEQSTVSNIALKWGFTHMGRFSRYYTDLFGENPSLTLRREYQGSMALEKSCASRQEDISD